MLTFLIVAAWGAFMILYGVTAWHKHEVTKALIYVGAAIFVIMITVSATMIAALQPLIAEQAQAIAEEMQQQELRPLQPL